MATTAAAQPLLYGCLINLYKQSLDGYVVATSSAEAPVGVQVDSPENPLRYEQTAFLLQRGDLVEASGSRRAGGDVVKYGHTIRLLHYAHQQPLSYHTERPAAGMKGNLRALLEKRGKNTLKVEKWRIMPRYRLRVEGEPVADGDPVVLQAADGDRYLNVALNVDEEAADNGFLEVSVGEDTQGFLMCLYDGDTSPQMRVPPLRCGDCVTLLHTEEHKYILADPTKKTCVLRTSDSHMADGDGAATGEANASGEQAVAWYAASKEEISYLSLFVVEAADARKGGALRTRGVRGCYRLKSLSSGLYLQCGEVAASAAPANGAGGIRGSNGSTAAAAGSNILSSPTFPSGLTGTGTNADLNELNSPAGAAVPTASPSGVPASPTAAEEVMSPTRLSAAAAVNGVRAGAGRPVRQTKYTVSLTPSAKAPGTLFQLHSASSGDEELLANGGRVFLSCVNSKNRKVWVVAGGPAPTDGDDSLEAETTIASLAHHAKTYGSVLLLGERQKSMRDGIEMRRLQPKALEELYMIRGLLPPLQKYVKEMSKGIGNPFQVRQARENLRQLQQLCHRAADAEEEAGPEELMNARNVGGGVLNPEWQSKVFQQGVGELALRVVKATLECPHVRPEKLSSMDMVYPQTVDASLAASVSAAPVAGVVAGAGAEEKRNAKGEALSDSGVLPRPSPLPSVTLAASPPTLSATLDDRIGSSPSASFVPMRYSELGELVATCFQLVRLLLYNRPRYAEALQGYADFVMQCTYHVPSALKCLAAFYSDNPTFVELPMARHRLDFFLDMLAKRGREPDVVHLLQLFACCGGEGMVEAQRIILDFFAKNRAVALRLLCPMRRMPVAPEVREALLSQLPEGSPRFSERAESSPAAAVPDGGGEVAGKDEPEGIHRSRGKFHVGSPLRLLKLQKTSKASPTTASAVRSPASPTVAESALRLGREVVMVGIPNSLFADPESGGDSLSIATSTQYRAKSSKLGELLQRAADAEDISALTFFPLEGLSVVMQDWPEVKDVLVPYLVAQVRLLAALANGKSKATSKPFIFEWLPRLVLVETLKSEALPRQLHAALLELFANVMMDVAGAGDLREQMLNIRCVITRTGSAADAPAASALQLTMRNVPEELVAAKQVVVRYLRRTLMSGDENVAAEYLSVLNLTDALVNIGAFELTEYDTLLRLLVQCVDPSCDDQRTYLEVQSVYDCKSCALRLMNTLTDVLLVREALNLVDCFRMERRPPTYSQITALNVPATAKNTASGERGEVQRWFGNGEAEKSAAVAPNGSPGGESSNTYAVEDRTAKPGLTPIAEMFRALLDLANRSHSSVIQRQVICLFFRVTNFLEELRATAMRVQLLTSEESIGFYAEIDRTSVALEELTKKSFRRSNTVALANSALDALGKFIAKAKYGAVAEKLSMMLHLGVPLQLIRLLTRLTVPLPEASRQLAFKAVTLMQTMSQNARIREELREAVADASPLVYQNTNYIALLRTLFVSDADNDHAQMPAGLLADVVRCLYVLHSTDEAIDFLCDWLAARGASGHVTAHRQQQLWRAIVSDQQAERCIQLRHSWCSDQGRELREKLLTSDESYDPSGRVATHLKMCRLLFLVANKTEFVKSEEIRQEVFGQNSLDAMLQVTTDSMLPVYFREPYTSLLQALVLDDSMAAPSLFAHRDFPDFLRLCMIDTVRYVQLLGGSSVFPEVEEELERREDAALRCPPKNATEEEMNEARFGCGAYESFFFGPLCACLQRVCARYRSGVSQLSNRVRTQLEGAINEVVDALCDVMQQVLAPRSPSAVLSEPTTAGVNSTRAASVTTAPFPETQWTEQQTTILRSCVWVAKENGFSGTARWRGAAFAQVCSRLDAYIETMTTATTTVKAPPPATGSSKDASDVAASTQDGANVLTGKWTTYLRESLLSDPRMAEENRLLSAAGILLRCGVRGTIFARMLFTVMPSLQRYYLVSILTLVRQLVVLAPNNPYDDSALLPLHLQDADMPFITITTSVPSRQSFLARWPGDTSLEVPVPLIAVVSEFIGFGKHDVQRAALLAGCTLLMKGNRSMQECFYSYCRRSANEQLFFVLRNHLIEFKDELRTYYHALANGGTPSEAVHYLSQMENCRLELRLLQLLCAGQYAPLQTYLVAQPDNNISVNVVEALVELLSMAPKTANEETSDFMLQLLSTTAESLQGPCLINQDTFVAYNAADYLTLLLSEYDPFVNPDAVFSSVETVVRRVPWYEARFGAKHKKKREAALVEEARRRCRNLLQTMALSTLLALIEGRDDSAFASKLISTVDLSVLGRSMDRSAATYEARHGSIVRSQTRGLLRGDVEGCRAVLARYLRDYIHSDYPTGRQELQDELALAVSIYTFFRACHDMHTLAVLRSHRAGTAAQHRRGVSQDVDEFVDKKGQSIRQVLRKTRSYRQVATKLAKIEVVRDGRLERVYFRMLNTALDNLLHYRKQHLIASAVRTSDNERIQYFFNKGSEVIVEVAWYARLRRCLLLFMMNFFSSEINAVGLAIVLAINLVMVIGIRAPTSPYEDGTSDGINRALRALGIADICVQGVLVIQAFFGPAIVSYKIGWQSWKSSKASRLTKRADNDIAADRGEVLQRGEDTMRPTWYEYAVYSLYFIFTDGLFLLQAFFLFVSIMGFVHHHIWYGLQLMQVSLSSPVLASLFTALANNAASLVLTLALLLIFVLFFAIISFYKFSDLFNPLSTRNNGFNCYTMSQCWLVHVDTLRSSGGIGDVMDWPIFYSKDGFGYWTEFFRMCYFVVVNLIGLNLFLGVIIDSLAQYRLEQQFVKTDQEKKCFICGIERNVFDVVQPGTYDTHIGEEHNMWQYLFFLHYLSEKDPESYTGQEAYIHQQVLYRDVTFYPIGKSLVLGAMEGGDAPSSKADTGASRGSGGGGGGGGDDGAGADDATAQAVLTLVEVALKTSIDPLKRKLEEMAESVHEVKEKLMPSGGSLESTSASAHPRGIGDAVHPDRSPYGRTRRTRR
ncbi:hypothetical protein ABB37_06626 [Leptomonas pyrrhocoris]|uniref:MIR domain-containing protein n=1 Tax=Leptomonas pyrrhocoris TaxID=157538 RepID=A0A0N0DTZ2_LEPPY|nr:hypothetical protein ABB37_06626 [Leptomonas pyrrhocoris]KPA77804.1 hypothetical protein ABB37_06626 [Leptomonas pyrrhocoris]|eukprot:XP_015656243.1 hypothetical protein ABB37_06626 [Leptomonas pyrrhocoris]